MKMPIALSIAVVLAAVVVTGIAAPGATPPVRADSDADSAGHHFIHRSGRSLTHRGAPFRVAGASNYYPMYVTPFMVDDLLNTAAASSFNVIRTWSALEIGNQDGSSSVGGGPKNGVYFHYWNGSAPAFNDGATGLQHLDYVIYRAGQLGLKVIMPLVNNWNDFGGMDQYVRWRGGQYHDDFYNDTVIRGWYFDWIAHLLNRTNMFTGIAYKDDATIMAWELANEPRCSAYGAYPASPACNTNTVTAWADAASKFIKSIDRKHLLSAGDEGFYCTPGATDWTENCSQGVDTIALANLDAMDAMSFHLYPSPSAWGKDAAWGTQWIQRHIADGRRIKERVLLGEFGWLDKATRNPVYKAWTDAVLQDGGAGALYWILSGKQDNGTLYPDFDGYTVYCPSPVCTAFTNFARRLEVRPPFSVSPVADDDLATIQHDTSVTIATTANDITYQNVPLSPDSVDLDVPTPGQQTQVTTAAGSYTLLSGGNVFFTPAPGFAGVASLPYTVKDAKGRLSNPATIAVTVKGEANVLYSFEDGVETWAPANFNPTAGSVAQSTSFATAGTHSLQVTGIDGGWFNPTFAAPLVLANIHHILFDLTPATVGISPAVSVQVGSSWTWCQTDTSYIAPGTMGTVDVDLASLFAACGAADTSVLQNINVYFNGGAVYYMDNMRTE